MLCLACVAKDVFVLSPTVHNLHVVHWCLKIYELALSISVFSGKRQLGSPSALLGCVFGASLSASELAGIVSVKKKRPTEPNPGKPGQVEDTEAKEA